MTITVGSAFLEPYTRFSLYNSPYPAHDEGCAIDCYPGTLRDGRTRRAPSPVSGTVLETVSVRAPPQPYAAEHDHLLLLECDGPPSVSGLIARILHVDPAVEAGDTVSRGDALGRLVRAGFFAPWVDNHLHVGFRHPDQHLHRASGSLPIELDVDVRPLEWNRTGTVVETGETAVVLDSPSHPNPGREFVGISGESYLDGDGGERDSSAKRRAGVLDGGLSHYDEGGFLTDERANERQRRVVSLDGERLGVARGRTITWDDLLVTANGETITGLSLFCGRDADFGVKLVCPGHSFSCGDRVTVRWQHVG